MSYKKSGVGAPTERGCAPFVQSAKNNISVNNIKLDKVDKKKVRQHRM